MPENVGVVVRVVWSELEMPVSDSSSMVGASGAFGTSGSSGLNVHTSPVMVFLSVTVSILQ